MLQLRFVLLLWSLSVPCVQAQVFLDVLQLFYSAFRAARLPRRAFCAFGGRFAVFGVFQRLPAESALGIFVVLAAVL